MSRRMPGTGAAGAVGHQGAGDALGEDPAGLKLGIASTLEEDLAGVGDAIACAGRRAAGEAEFNPMLGGVLPRCCSLRWMAPPHLLA
jgi:hypothetical protein